MTETLHHNHRLNHHLSHRLDHQQGQFDRLIRLARLVPTSIPRLMLLVLLTVIIPLILSTPAQTSQERQESSQAPLHYELSVSFDPAKHQLIGTAKIDIPAKRQLTLYFPGITITGSLLRNAEGKEASLQLLYPQQSESESSTGQEVENNQNHFPGNWNGENGQSGQNGLILPLSDQPRSLFLSYRVTAHAADENQISANGVSLLADWYPLPAEPVLFTLHADLSSLPKNFMAISESDQFPLQRSKDIVNAHFSHPTRSLHFIAGPYQHRMQKVHDNLTVHTLFFPEDRELAAGYLQSIADYLQRFEPQLGPFPYSHYVVVANRQPTGYGMPTFTLLGQQVLRLPFIRATSLGHEVVHSWFGNSVEVRGANWCEGLTSYLTDHQFRADKGEGAADRRETIAKYLSYTERDNSFTLADFRSAGHNQPMADARRVVGYNRGAMFFHELRNLLGEDVFNAGLRVFYKQNRDKNAGWDELLAAFSLSSGKDLTTFFRQRLTRPNIPALSLKEPVISYADDKYLLRFTLVQSAPAYELNVPVAITSSSGEQLHSISTSNEETSVEIPLQERPLAITIDPNFELMRGLSPSENPPVWSSLLGSSNVLVVVGSEQEKATLQPLIRQLSAINPPRVFVRNGLEHETSQEKEQEQETLTDKLLAEHDLLFFGAELPCRRKLFAGSISHNLKERGTQENTFSVDVRRNPLNPAHIAVLLDGTAQQAASLIRRLSHYGRYSYLAFENGRNSVKLLPNAEAGIQYLLEELPRTGATSATDDFASLISQLSAKRVIYFGETHTSLADHRLQLRVIEELYKQNPELIIGMEMFPEAAQPVLDRYTLDSQPMTIREFLRLSEYYRVWGYDFRLFRDIFLFARNHHVRVVGLNIDRSVVSDVFRSGSTDTIPDEITAKIPERDLDMPGYIDRLQFIHSGHMSQMSEMSKVSSTADDNAQNDSQDNFHGSNGFRGFSGFIQAQALWDEAMADSIVRTLHANPNARMVVIAGSQHTRKDSGIPPRVVRRMNGESISQASLITIGEYPAPDNLAEIADYYLFTVPESLPDEPKIGIVLNEIGTSEAMNAPKNTNKSGNDATAETAETAEPEKKPGLYISELAPTSKAGEAGLLPGDRLISIDSLPVQTMTELKAAMFDRQPGDLLPVSVARQQEGQETEQTFSVMLTTPQQPMMPLHP